MLLHESMALVTRSCFSPKGWAQVSDKLPDLTLLFVREPQKPKKKPALR